MQKRDKKIELILVGWKWQKLGELVGINMLIQYFQVTSLKKCTTKIYSHI
jgi:hypothetical protein